jgi:hypothetical protein
LQVQLLLQQQDIMLKVSTHNTAGILPAIHTPLRQVAFAFWPLLPLLLPAPTVTALSTPNSPDSFVAMLGP